MRMEQTLPHFISFLFSLLFLSPPPLLPTCMCMTISKMQIAQLLSQWMQIRRRHFWTDLAIARTFTYTATSDEYTTSTLVHKQIYSNNWNHLNEYKRWTTLWQFYCDWGVSYWNCSSLPFSHTHHRFFFDILNLKMCTEITKF